MFENETQETIMQRMIEKAGDEVSIVEGSLLYSAVSLIAVALEDAYDKLEEVYLNAFEDTCDREHLIRFARKKNMTPKLATKAIYSVKADAELQVGDELTNGKYNFTVTQGGTEALIECQTAGSEGNGLTGSLSAVTFIENLNQCQITAQVILSENEEETEDFRDRFLEALNVSNQYGNLKGYKALTEGIDGVGKAAVSTYSDLGLKWVKIYVTDEGFKAPTSEKVAEIQEIIDPVSGSGEGLASIGHRVSVSAAAEVKVNISASLTLESGVIKEDILPLINSAVDEYFASLNSDFGDESIVVRKSRIESAAIKIGGVVDFEIKTLNGSESNLTLEDGEVAVRGDVNTI
jgi:uncharacterized phage protein gp47/JayE